MNNHDYLLSKIFFKDGRIDNSNNIRYKKNKCHYVNICNYLAYRYDDSRSERETLYRILYGIEVRPVCKVCGNEVKFNGRNGVIFLSHCSNKCKKLDNEVNEKWKESCGERGTNREKAKITMCERYGYDNAYKIPEVIERIKDANKKNRQESLKKREQTCINKYGVSSYMKTKEFSEKSKHTSLTKYGTEFPIQSKIVKEKYDWNLISKKINATKFANGTFNTSKDEDLSYILLKEKYSDTIRQYKDERYPFNCDFYIPSLDLFIECQYGWQHGKHPFDINSEEDNYYINKIKDKHTKYYDNVIYNWTIRDVHKRNIAKQNNLNYIEFWNINELKQWIQI